MPTEEMLATATFYKIREPTVYKAEIIPEHIPYETNRRGVWKQSKMERLERGYCHNFVNPKSYNANAGLSSSELAHAENVLTLYKWLTRNSNTDMN